MTSNEMVLGQLVYIIPSILLYIIEIYVMFFGIYKSKFNKLSFNQIFFIYAVNNIIAEILYYFFFRMTTASVFFGLFEHLLGYHIVLVLLRQVLYHTSLVTNLLDLVLSMNRFSAIVMPMKYKHFWIGKIKWIVVFMVIFPYICFWTFPFQQITMIYKNDTKNYLMIPQKLPPITWPSTGSILGTCVTVTCLGCFVCNAYVGFKLHRRKNNIISSNEQQEKLYFLFTLCIFANQLLSCSTQWMLGYVNKDIWQFIMNHQFVIADLANMLPPWIILFMNFTLRKAIYDTVIKYSKPTTVATTMTLRSKPNNYQLF